MAEKIKKYRPSNGTEGIYFMEKFCDKCYYDRNSDCEILARTLIFDVNDPEYPKEWTYKNNSPVCTKFKDIDDKEPVNKAIPDLPGQTLFKFAERLKSEEDKS